jgi:hypothetical protein
MAKRLTYRQKQERAARRAGLACLAITAAAFAALIAGAYHLDKARGITVAESLASAGI